MSAMTAEERLIEYARSRHREPWNYWPSVSVLGRIKDEGAGASHSTAGMRDGGLGALIDRFNRLEVNGIEKDRRCADVRAACVVMPDRLHLIVKVGYLSCASQRDVPRCWPAAVQMSGLSESTYARRKRHMLAWLADYLCITQAEAA